MSRLALAALASVVALAFGLSTFERWLVHRRPHELAWSIALALFAGGALALLAGAAGGWDATTFRLFYWLGAIANVPVLAVGTVYLLAGRRVGHVAAVVVGGLVVFSAGVVAAAPLTAGIDPDVLPQGSEVFGPLPRVLAALASGGGAVVVFGGAAWSTGRLVRRSAGTHRGERPPHAGRMAGGNALLALGTLVLSLSGLLNSVLGEMDAFALTLAAGIVVLFVGFLVATPTGVSRVRESTGT